MAPSRPHSSDPTIPNHLLWLSLPPVCPWHGVTLCQPMAPEMPPCYGHSHCQAAVLCWKLLLGQDLNPWAQHSAQMGCSSHGKGTAPHPWHAQSLLPSSCCFWGCRRSSDTTTVHEGTLCPSQALWLWKRLGNTLPRHPIASVCHVPQLLEDGVYIVQYPKRSGPLHALAPCSLALCPQDLGLRALRAPQAP